VSFVLDKAVEALVVLGSGDEMVERARALIALDIDALWWRDEASYTRPEALMQALTREVLPQLRSPAMPT
jgi:hypothetical protein